jgi:hypothetical protein
MSQPICDFYFIAYFIDKNVQEVCYGGWIDEELCRQPDLESTVNVAYPNKEDVRKCLPNKTCAGSLWPTYYAQVLYVADSLEECRRKQKLLEMKGNFEADDSDAPRCRPNPLVYVASCKEPGPPIVTSSSHLLPVPATSTPRICVSHTGKSKLNSTDHTSVSSIAELSSATELVTASKPFLPSLGPLDEMVRKNGLIPNTLECM